MALGLVRRPLLTAATVAVGLSVLAGALTWHITFDRVLQDTAMRGDNVLQLATASLAGQLDRFERLPALIADQPAMRRLATTPRDPAVVDEANAYLERIQAQLGATDVYLMDADGLTVAASNHAQAATFIGRNFAFRPYFHDAIVGGTGRFYALGTTSRKRGYYFGAPVRTGGRIAGVLVFKVDLDAIEDAWRGADYAVIVTDPDGVIFLSSRSEWLVHALRPLGAEARARLDLTRRYADTPVGLLEVTQDAVEGPHHLLRIDGTEYIQRDMPMPQAGWQVHVLTDTAAARREAWTAAMLSVLLVGLVGMSAFVLWQQRARLAERLQMQAEARADLQRRVEERTAELKQAQTDLVQAGKLAALGQMSAALSHEFNQPLAAARTFADNAGVLLDRGRLDEARGNINRIQGLIDRLASISRHLNSFARKPNQVLAAVALPDVVEAAVEIASLRLKAAKAELTIALAPALPLVIAGPVRLQQVLVNILTNAADATEAHKAPRITLAAMVEGDDVLIRVTDNGPRVAEALRQRIFDPFFSTKGVGKGLGLGLSISYNIVKDFGGELAVAGAPGGGAVFTVRLKQAGLPGTALAPLLQSAAE